MMGRVVAIVNQKGGVGKTTTAVNLAAALAVAERMTLLIDSDPQANTTRALGYDPDPERVSLYDVLVGETSLETARKTYTDLPYLTVVPSDRELVGVEIELVGRERREYRLREEIAAARELYDYVLIDCPPSLGLITLNALVAADEVLIPVQCEFLALEGVSQLVDTVHRIRDALNPGLRIGGVLMTMFDERTNLARQVVDEVRSVFGDRVFKTIIPRNVRLSEAPSHGKPIFLYDIRSRGAEAYLQLAREFMDHDTQSTGARPEQSDSRVAGSTEHPGPVAGDERRLPDDRHRPDPA